ncbi:RecT-like ssDNA annealing protein [Gordonia phage UmaThurman]|uniref:RecT-like ssDNA annealing protein n=1 Tax=Gordonia phage UmaThurman TaxID=1821563 RepID=UPI00078DBD07|nr:RecT-like ssDNA annealing protein [Gordonia phage UmaThurman]AMS03956.1 RecT-like ssDNA binding protein [Gordonia phage UmaThurman]
MSSTEIATTGGAVATQPTTELTIRSDQSEFTPIQRAALAQIGVEEASDDDVKVFFHQAKRTGLDPFAKQIYMIGRRTKVKEWNPNTSRQEEKWVMKQTIQIGIDGYRLACRRIANALGIKLEVDGPYWHDGTQWLDVWLDAGNPPKAAKFTVTRDGEKYTAIANYAEYVQTYNSSNGPQPTSMWAKMPANQLAKCAEAAARRQAFPDQFSGVVFEEAAHTVIDSEVVDEAPKKEGGRGAAGLAAALGVTDEDPSESTAKPESEQVVDAEVETDTEPTKEQFKRLNDLFVAAGLTKDDKNGRRIVAAQLVPDRDPDAPLTAANVDHIADMLQQLRDQGEQVLIDTVESLITEHDTEGPAK